MALKQMRLEEMVQISAPWVAKKSAARALIESEPALAVVLPKLEAAHQACIALQPRVDRPELAALTAEAQEVDQQHDLLVRGIHGALTSIATFSPQAQRLLELRDTLLPEGLGQVRLTFRAE